MDEQSGRIFRQEKRGTIMSHEKPGDSLFGNIGDDTEFRKRYGELIGEGMTAVIYAHNGIVAKVYREGQPKFQAFKEAFTLAVVEELGIPAPNVYSVETVRSRTAVLMDQVWGISLMDMYMENPEKLGEYLDKAVELQNAMHKAFFSEFLPQKIMLQGMINASPSLNQEEKDRLNAMLDTLPDGFSICHGDFHFGNILYDGISYKIIDWAEVSSGCPAADACRSYLDYCMASDELSRMYLEKYCTASGIPREEILVWLPVVAGALYGYLSDEGKKIVKKYF